MKIKAEGILRHMFHGTYSCAIALEFNNEKDCEAAFSVLNVGIIGVNMETGNWNKSKTNSNVAIGSLNSEQLQHFKEKFNPKAKPCNAFDCKGDNNIHEIDSLAHSIDFGPPFAIELEMEDPNQEKLF